MREPGRHVEGVTGAEKGIDNRWATGREVVALVDGPVLGAVRLQDEHVVRVLVSVETLSTGWRNVRIRLDRMSEGQFQPSAVVGENLPVAMHALEHDGGARR